MSELYAERRHVGWRHRLRRHYSDKRIEALLDVGERAAEIRALGVPEAEANRTTAEAIATIAGALEGTDNAAIKLGSIVYLKVRSPDGSELVVIRTLSASEMRQLDDAEEGSTNLLYELAALQTGKSLLPSPRSSEPRGLADR